MTTEYMNQFFISVLTKDGNKYEPTFLRSLVASLEGQLKKKGYSARIRNDLVFEKTREVQTAKEARRGKSTQSADSFDKRRTKKNLDYFGISEIQYVL